MTVDSENLIESAKKAPVHLLARINAIAVKIAAPFIASDDIRYYLCGINIRGLEDGGVMVTATDGHRYIVIRDKNGIAEEELTVSVHKDALKHANNKNTFDVLSDGTALIKDKYGVDLFIQAGNSLIGGHFPKIENIVQIQGYQEGFSGSVNPNYLKDAITVGQHFGGIRFFTKKEYRAPIIFVVGEALDLSVFGGIMPRDEVIQMPSWLPKRTEHELELNQQG
jgi:hypothetical protein